MKHESHDWHNLDDGDAGCTRCKTCVCHSPERAAAPCPFPELARASEEFVRGATAAFEYVQARVMDGLRDVLADETSRRDRESGGIGEGSDA